VAGLGTGPVERNPLDPTGPAGHHYISQHGEHKSVTMSVEGATGRERLNKGSAREGITHQCVPLPPSMDRLKIDRLRLAVIVPDPEQSRRLGYSRWGRLANQGPSAGSNWAHATPRNTSDTPGGVTPRLRPTASRLVDKDLNQVDAVCEAAWKDNWRAGLRERVLAGRAGDLPRGPCTRAGGSNGHRCRRRHHDNEPALSRVFSVRGCRS
jgi:hypothetical protein